MEGTLYILQLNSKLPNQSATFRQITDKEVTIWVPFSSEELRSAIEKYSDNLTSRLDKFS